MKTYKGTNASPGWSSSKAFFFNSELNFQKEVKYDFETGLKLLNKKYIELISNLNSSQREVESEIITAYKLILNDPEILSNCRLVDSRDIIGIYDVFISTAEIIVLNLKKVKGFIVENAGLTSHTVIVAKNLGIPCVIGIDVDNIDSTENSIIAINGFSGEVFVEPDGEIIRQVEEYKLRNLDVKSNYTKKNISQLGIEFRANIGNEEELELFDDKLIKSIGLFRSEFIYIDSKTPPTLKEQISINNKLSSKFSETIVFRTLDIGGDKTVPYLNLPIEENPFLGIRGIRFSFTDEKLFREQIISILSSELVSKVKIMFPMVALLEDLIFSLLELMI